MSELKKENLVLKSELQKYREQLAVQAEELETQLKELRTNNEELGTQIEERKRAEDAARIALAYNRSLIEVSLDPLVTISSDGRITDVNEATERVTGFSRDWLIGTDFSNYFSSPDNAREGYLRVFNEGTVKDYPLEIRHSDGHLTPVLYNASVYKDETGKAIGVFAAARDITERKKAEDKARVANAYNRSLIEASLDPLVTIAPDGSITDVNEATERITGYPREHLIGTDFSIYFKEAIKAKEGYLAAFKEGTVKDYPLQIRRRDGHLTPVLYNASVYRDETGQVIGVFAAARDISERKNAEEALKLSNAYNRSLIEASMDPLVTITPDGQISDVNIATEAITGYSRNDLIGTDFSNYFTGPAKAREGYLKVFDKGSVKDYPLEIRNKNGRVTPVIYNASVYRDDAGKVVGVFAAARDITELNRLEKARLSLAAIVDSSDDAIIGKTLDGAITSWNAGAIRLYGYPENDVLGKSISILVPPGYPDEIPGILGRVQSGEHIDHYETLRKRKDGGIISVSLSVSPIKDTGGRIVGASTIARDITDKKRAEEAIKMAGAYNRSLIETSLDPLVTISPDGKITDVNKATEVVTGHPREHLIGTDFSEYFTDPERAKEGYLKVFEEGSVTDYPLEICHKDGHATPVLYNASVYRSEAGRVIGVFAAARDITELKRAETALQEKREALESQAEELEAQAEELRANNDELERQILERRRAEEAARLALAYNRSLIEASLDPLVTISPDGKITDVNQATEKVTGLSRGDLIGTDFSDYFTEPQKARKGYMQVLIEGVATDYALEIKCRDGHVTPVLYNASVYNDDKGRVIGIFAAARDVSEIKRAEEAVKFANAYNRSLIEASLDPLVTISPDGRITDVNKATEKATGIPREQLIGTDFSDYFTEPDKAKKGYLKVFKEGSIMDYPLEIKQSGGSIMPVVYNATVYRDESDKVIGVFAAARDITERRQAEMAVQEKQEELESQAEELEAQTEELRANNDELERQILERRRAEEELSRSYDELDERVKERTSQLQHSNDELKIQINERERAEKDLVEAKLAAELYLDLMGHDISNMHQIAIGQLEMAREIMDDEGGLKPGNKELIETSLDTLGRSARLIENVRNLQRLRNGEFKEESIDLNDLLSGIVKEYEFLVPDNSIKFNGNGQSRVRANKLLRDVFSNLVGNAIKHANGNKVAINIVLENVGENGNNYYQVSVEDNGPGVSDDMKDKIFNRLQRGQTKARGMGIGLYLVKSLVESYHGMVWAEDRVKGDHAQGARFVVLLPVMEGRNGN